MRIYGVSITDVDGRICTNTAMYTSRKEAEKAAEKAKIKRWVKTAEVRDFWLFTPSDEKED